jgi:hypothetical protein
MWIVLTDAFRDRPYLDATLAPWSAMHRCQQAQLAAQPVD